jgi:hypothetical protein
VKYLQDDSTVLEVEMPKADRTLNDLDVSVGPHPARREWRTLRVNFNADVPDQRERVAEAIRALYSPTATMQGQPQKAGH